MAFTVGEIASENIGSLEAKIGSIINTIGTSGGSLSTGLSKVYHMSFQQFDSPATPALARNVQIDVTNAVPGCLCDGNGNVAIVVDGALDTRFTFIAMGV